MQLWVVIYPPLSWSSTEHAVHRALHPQLCQAMEWAILALVPVRMDPVALALVASALVTWDPATSDLALQVAMQT